MLSKLSLGAVLLFVMLGNLALADEEAIAWNDLSADQQTVLGQFSGTWNALPVLRQNRLAMGANRWLKMDQKQRKQAQLRLARWKNMTSPGCPRPFLFIASRWGIERSEKAG